MYLTIEEYKEDSGLIKDEKVLNKFLKQTKLYIDTLTYNRIRSIGFENCSEFEKEIIKAVQVELIDFYYSNQDMINSYLSSYSINGVNISLASANPNIFTINGIPLLKSTYNKLCLTRFTSLIL